MREGQIVHFRPERRIGGNGRIKGCAIPEGREIGGCTLKPENLDIHFDEDTIEAIWETSNRLNFTSDTTSLVEVVSKTSKFAEFADINDVDDHPELSNTAKSYVVRLIEDQDRDPMKPDLYASHERDERSTADGTPQDIADTTGSCNNMNSLLTDGI